MRKFHAYLHYKDKVIKVEDVKLGIEVLKVLGEGELVIL